MGVAFLILLAAGCAEPPSPQRPAVPVTVATVEEAVVPMELRAIGTVEAYQTVEVKSLVGGTLIEVGFHEGQEVKKGQVLFRIDPRPFEAALAQAEGVLARDRVQLDLARQKYDRKEALFRDQLVSQEERDEALTAVETLAATVRAEEAAATRARLELEYATIRAPIGGRAGDLRVDVGNVVKANADQPMVTIHRIRPVRVRFAVPERDLAAVRQAMTAQSLAVRATPSGDAGKTATGSLVFLDNAVDASTGTVLLKGEFENADDALWPGQFVDVALVLDEGARSLVVPDGALLTGQQGPYVYVVGPDQVATVRTVRPGRNADGRIVVEEGLSAGEVVVTDGQLGLAPGAKVAVKTTASPSAAASPGSPGGR